MIYKQKGSKFYWVGFRDPARKGKFIRQSTGTEDFSEAQEIERTMALGIHGKIDQSAMERILRAIYKTEVGIVGMRLDEAWTKYRQVIVNKGRVQEKDTARALELELERFVSWAKESRGIKVIRQVTSQVALDYAGHMKKVGQILKDGTRKPIKDKTRKNRLSNLSSIWHVLEGIEPEIRDPWKNTIPVVRDGERGEAFTREQEAAILEAAGKSPLPEWRTVCLVARHTGLRRVDVFNLRLSQVDMKRGVIELEPHKTKNFEIAVAIPIVKTLREALEKHLESLKATQKPKSKKADGMVFPKFAVAYRKDPKEEDFGSILKRAGVSGKGLTFHSYRHTFRTRLREAGVPDELAKQLGGWTQDSTLARYNHADETEKLRAQMEKA